MMSKNCSGRVELEELYSSTACGVAEFQTGNVAWAVADVSDVTEAVVK